MKSRNALRTVLLFALFYLFTAVSFGQAAGTPYTVESAKQITDNPQQYFQKLEPGFKPYFLRLREVGGSHRLYEWHAQCMSKPPQTVDFDGSRSANWGEGFCTSFDSAPAVLVPESALSQWIHGRENSYGTAPFWILAVLALLMFLVILAVIVAGWLAPIYIAKKRGHPNLQPIAVVTVLLGWTFIGWAVCLAWALANIPKPVNSGEEVTR